MEESGVGDPPRLLTQIFPCYKSNIYCYFYNKCMLLNVYSYYYTIIMCTAVLNSVNCTILLPCDSPSIDFMSKFKLLDPLISLSFLLSILSITKKYTYRYTYIDLIPIFCIFQGTHHVHYWMLFLTHSKSSNHLICRF